MAFKKTSPDFGAIYAIFIWYIKSEKNCGNVTVCSGKSSVRHAIAIFFTRKIFFAMLSFIFPPLISAKMG